MSLLHWVLSDPDVVMIYGFNVSGKQAVKDLVKQIDFTSKDPEDPDHPVLFQGEDLKSLVDTPYRVALVDFARLRKQEIMVLLEHLNAVEATYKRNNDDYQLKPIIAFDFVNRDQLAIPACVYPLSSITERKQIKTLVLDIFDNFETAQVLYDTSEDTLRVASIYRALRDAQMVSLNSINHSFDYANIDKVQMLKDFDVIRCIEGRDCIREHHIKDRYVYIF